MGSICCSAWLLRDEHHHDDHDDDHDHEHSRDLNLRAAYVHVLADAAVSILAVTGLIIARELGWLWIDAAMGIIGAAVISNWAFGLMPNLELVGSIQKCLEEGSDRIADLHLWQLDPDTMRLLRRSSHTNLRRRASTRDDWQTQPVLAT